MRARFASIVFSATAGLVAQQPQPEFRSGVDVVRIPVSVMRSGQPVIEGLTAADFTLMEDGVAQSIAVFERETVPLSLCIALDVSGSMINGPAELAVSAIGEVTAALRPTDEIAIMTFAERPKVVVPWSTPAAAARLSPSAEIAGGTSLHDATRAALELLDSASNPRPVILLITDGLDNASRARLPDVVKNRRQSEAQVFAFGVTPDPEPKQVDRFRVDVSVDSVPETTRLIPSKPVSGINSLADLIGDSGGRSFLMENPGDPRRFALQLMSELRNQYTIGYAPAKPFDGTYRRVKVEVKKRGYQVRHRGGYLALPSTK